MDLSTLNSLLWNERQLLELLLFKLEEEQLLLAAGKSRWLSHATREVENVLEQIRGAELAREVETTHVAAQLGLPTHATLLDICERAEDPWGNSSPPTGRHCSLSCPRLMRYPQATKNFTTAQRAISETIAHYQRDEKTYDHTGATRSTTDSPAQIFDQSL